MSHSEHVQESPRGPEDRHRSLLDELIADVPHLEREASRELIAQAFAFAAQAHEGQYRLFGGAFIFHPVATARICANLRLDEQAIAGALLHDVLEETTRTRDDLRAAFGAQVAELVEGVTELSRIEFRSRGHAETESYRKLLAAMARDTRVILIKLADRLHELRTREYLPRRDGLRMAREALEIYARLAHRLGLHAIKSELEDRAFHVLHPRKYEEIQQWVAQGRAERERHIQEAAMALTPELDKAGIPVEISTRAKHLYSIYDKMVRKGREFHEIMDLTAMRVIVERRGDDGTRDCYGTLGVIHSLWKPMPGRFKDFIAMPRGNSYRALHTTVIGPGGPLEIQVRTREIHDEIDPVHWRYKERLSEDNGSAGTSKGPAFFS